VGRYRKIDPRIWNDAKFRTLSDKGKLTFLFILTHPYMTSLGAMRATVSGLAEELHWGQKAFAEAFEEGLGKGLFQFDAEASFLGVPNFLKYNPPESPNVVKSWEKIVDLIPECQMKNELIEYVKDFLKGLGEPFRKALPKEVERLCLIPNPNPNPIPNPIEENPPTPLPGGKSPSPQKLAELWNDKAPPELARVNIPLTRKPKDMDKIKDALKRNPERAWWERVILRLFDSPHCRGMNDRGWKASFDFMVSHAEVILDGKYDGAKSGVAEPKGFEGIREFLTEEGGLT
jgi:hypothetical protein